jgi:sugar O-acyltransferase (sialic acid O-acetyltransferase NeuD family)
MSIKQPVRLVILGAGGDALVVAEAIRQAIGAGHDMELAGFLDDILAGQKVDGLPVLGKLDDWSSLSDTMHFIPAIQKVRDMPRRASRLEELHIPPARWAKVIHPRAVVARNVKIGAGVYIAACATVQPGCVIGDFATLRGGAALGHDATVERHGYVGPNATLCGKTIMREGAHLGPNAVVLDARQVGRFSVIGIGSAVTKDIAEFTVVMGNPARRVGRVKGFGAHMPITLNSEV